MTEPRHLYAQVVMSAVLKHADRDVILPEHKGLYALGSVMQVSPGKTADRDVIYAR